MFKIPFLRRIHYHNLSSLQPQRALPNYSNIHASTHLRRQYQSAATVKVLLADERTRQIVERKGKIGAVFETDTADGLACFVRIRRNGGRFIVECFISADGGNTVEITITITERIEYIETVK